MKRFRYIFDPVCLAAIVCYAANRWLVPPGVKNGFLRGHFADLLLIPAALPLMMWVQRRLGLRRHDAPPDASEIWTHVIVWSFAAEVIAPHLFRRATGDPWDVVAYAAGGLGAMLLWSVG